MKENSAELVSNKIARDTGALIKRMQSNLKGVKPFMAVKPDPLEVAYHLEQSGYLDDPTELINEFGYEKTAKFLNNYWELRGKRNA